MQEYQYFVAPFVGKLKSGESVNVVSEQLASLINHYAAHGWDFYSLDNVDIEVKPGCLAGLFGAQTSYITFNQAIFRKPK